MDKQSILTYSGRQITLPQLCQKWIHIFLFTFSLINLPFTYDFAVFFISFVRSLSNCKDTSVVIYFVNMQRNKLKCKEHVNTSDSICSRTIWLTEAKSVICTLEFGERSYSVLVGILICYNFAVSFASFVRSLLDCKDKSVLICFVNMQRNKRKCKEHMNSSDSIYLRTIWLTETGSILCAPESCQHSLSVARNLGIWDKNCLLTGDRVSVFSRTPTLWIFFTPSLLYSPGKKAKGTCFVMWERKDLPMRHRLVFE